MKSLFLAFAWLIIPAAIWAGWADHAPVSINNSANPTCDVHANSGGRRIVRINNTIIAICPQGTGERTWRSTDNGATWTEIDTDGTYSGCLITGKDSIVYHFFARRSGTSVTAINMVKFKYNEMPPAPDTIYSPNTTSGILSGAALDSRYHMLNAIADSSGRLYVATHWGNPDRVYLLTSADYGQTWTGPYQVSETSTGCCFYVHLEVNTRNVLFAVYKDYSNLIKCGRSTDHGQTWTVTGLASGLNFLHNPALVTIGDSTLFVCAQMQSQGLYGAFSYDQGSHWQGWARIERTTSYGDPSAGLANDSGIFVAFRGDQNRASTDYRSRITRSHDNGTTWTAVDSFYEAPYKVGCRSQIRYQTWWNYGGPLEWIWMQTNASGEGADIWYDRNDDVRIMNIQDDSSTTRIGEQGLGISKENEIVVWPNPFNPVVTIRSKNSEASSKHVDIQVFNTQGQRVFMLSTCSLLLATGVTWDASGYPSGTYCVVAKVNGKRTTQKIALVK